MVTTSINPTMYPRQRHTRIPTVQFPQISTLHGFHADHLAPLALLRPAAKELIHAYHAAQFHFTLSLMTIDPNNSDLRDPKVWVARRWRSRRNIVQVPDRPSCIRACGRRAGSPPAERKCNRGRDKMCLTDRDQNVRCSASQSFNKCIKSEAIRR
jgi:hypothetical protein